MNPTKPNSDAGYLEAASRIIFMGGLNRQVVDGKWPGFRAAFHNFDVAKVAGMGPDDIERLASDDRVIKYRKKLEAVVTNAQEMHRIAGEHGSFEAYVDSLYESAGLEGVTKELSRHFAYISENDALLWLYSTGYDIEEVRAKIMRHYSPFLEYLGKMTGNIRLKYLRFGR